MNDMELIKQLKTIFIQEAKERLNNISTSLIEIEQLENDDEKASTIIETVFRDIHSLKGAARSVSLNHFESVFQILETFFSDIKNGLISLAPVTTEFMLNIFNKMDTIVSENEIDSAESIKLTSDLKREIEGNIKSFSEFEPDLPSFDINDRDEDEKETDKDEEAITGKKANTNKKAHNDKKINTHKTVSIDKEKSQGSSQNSPIEAQTVNTEPEIKVKQKTNTTSTKETVRISSGKLDSLLLKSENLIRIKQMFIEDGEKFNNFSSGATLINTFFHKIQSDYLFLKQQYQNLERQEKELTGNRSLKNILSFMELLEPQLKNFESSGKKLIKTVKANIRSSEKIIDNFLLDIKEIAMLPFSNILDIFPRMVKGIAKDLNKEINFHISGDDNQIDRRILQEIKDPLIHLIRNCIDHGIETGDERELVGKPLKGNIDIIIIQEEGGKIKISIKDDGKGIDEQRIRSKLAKENIISDEKLLKITKEELIDYLFFSGFSTKNIITDISGRGLGLAIVKEKIEGLGGKVVVTSKKGKGTTFDLILPVALATFKGVLVKANNRQFILPSTNVEKVIRLQNPNIKKVENKNTITYLGITYPLVKLSNILKLPLQEEDDTDKKDENFITAVIIEKNNKYMALMIDTVISEQEILVKTLGYQLEKVNNISGATVLTSGNIVPILNVQDIFYSARTVNYIPPAIKNSEKVNTNEQGRKKSSVKQKSLLVVEDSITSRILLKNILESSGYKVDTAVDGMAAMTKLKSIYFDLVVSDVEMPRMDGFVLTETIRKDNELRNIPVILVTSRATDKDKERGITAGANAYIIKSQFDQNNLLETIKSLI